MKLRISSVNFFPQFITLISVIGLLVITPASTFAATKTWNKVGGGDWGTGANWTPAGVPAANDDVILIPLSASTNSIDNVPTITLNSLTMSGSGVCWIMAQTSGNVVTIRNTWTVPTSSTLTIGASGARLVWTCSTTCIATLNGYVAFDAGNTNRNFTVNGKLIIPASGMLFDPNPTGGSDFYLTATATLVTGKSQGLTVTSPTSAAGINFNVAVCMGGPIATLPELVMNTTAQPGK